MICCGAVHGHSDFDNLNGRIDQLFHRLLQAVRSSVETSLLLLLLQYDH